MWSSCRLVPHRTGQVAFPTSGSSVPVQGRHATTRIDLVLDLLRWPSYPGKRISEALPIVAPFLALSIEPFVHELRELSSERAAHLPVVRDSVVVQMPYQF